MNIQRNPDGRIKKIYTVNDNYFDVLNNEKTWLLGLFASDGNISKNTVSISQSGKEGLKIIKYIKTILNSSGKIHIQKTKGNLAYALYITSKKLVSALANFNIRNAKSLIYEFPEKLPKEFIPHFIRGYIDGDGCIGIYFYGKTNALMISLVGTKNFIFKVNTLVPISTNAHQIKRAKNLWELRWYGEKAIKLGEWIYSDSIIFESYKKKKYDYFLNNYNPRYLKYKEIKEHAKLLKEQGMTGYRIAKEMGMGFQTIYEWIQTGII